MTFATNAHRDFYVQKDEVHHAFAAELLGAIQDVWVGDFEDGVW